MTGEARVIAHPSLFINMMIVGASSGWRWSAWARWSGQGALVFMPVGLLREQERRERWLGVEVAPVVLSTL